MKLIVCKTAISKRSFNLSVNSEIASNSLTDAIMALAAGTVQPQALLTTQLLSRVEMRMQDLMRPGSSLGVISQAITAVAVSAADVGCYHLKTGGRRMRARLALHASVQLGLSQADAITIAAAVELLHNASLIHDDLQDRDRVRRDQETAWFRYGDNAAICSGDLMLSAAYAALATFSQPRYLAPLMALVHVNTAMAVEGQFADLKISANSQSSESQTKVNWLTHYDKIVQAKSGALLSLPLEMALTGAGMAEFAGRAKNAANAFAIGYQIADDISDVDHDRARGCCNIVLMIEKHHFESTATSTVVAIAIAKRHLENAIAQSKRLPCHAGDLLQDLAQTLVQKLAAKPSNTKLH